MNDDEPKSKRLKSDDSEKSPRKLIIVLENCSLESAKCHLATSSAFSRNCIQIGKTYAILSSDKHRTFLEKHNKNPSNYRPDIVHQCLLMLLDSPLNRAGLMQIFVHTDTNVLIQVSPQTRLPRTYDRFAGLMVQLLHKLSIRAADSSQKLLKVIKNPVTAHLPVGCRKLLTSFKANDLVDVRDVVPLNEEPIVIVVGAMARGKVTTDYTEQELKVSNYPLSAALTCAKVTGAFEEKWKIV